MTATIASPAPVTSEAPHTARRSGAGQVSLAVARVGVGFIFLWAFFDKLFGLGYSTAPAKSVLSGGSPTKGFLSHVDVGPFQSFFHSIAGTGIADWLFMTSLLGIGVAMVLGAGLRIAAVSNVLLMLGMWAAEWPMAKVAADGSATGSSNPFMDTTWPTRSSAWCSPSTQPVPGSDWVTGGATRPSSASTPPWCEHHGGEIR